VERLLIQALAVHAGPMSLDMLRKLPEAMSEALEPSQTLEGLMTRLCMMRLSKRLQARRDVLPSYRISHEICRKVVLEGVSPERRRALLIAIAGAVPDGPEAASRRFALLAAAEADEEAAQHAEEALMWARSRLASSQAAKIRRWVLERTQEQGASYTAKIRELAQLEATSGRFHEAAEQWHQLGEAAHASQSSATASALWLEEGRMWLRAGELANARAALARAEGAIAQRLHRSPTARLSALWRSWSSSATRRQQALQRRDVVLSAEVQTASRLEALALRLDPLVSGGRGARRREELEVLGWEHHSPALLARAWAMGLERLLERDFARAMHEGDAVLGEIVAYQRRQRDNAGLLFGLTLRGRLHHLAGEYSEAAATWREARQGGGPPGGGGAPAPRRGDRHGSNGARRVLVLARGLPPRHRQDSAGGGGAGEADARGATHRDGFALWASLGRQAALAGGAVALGGTAPDGAARNARRAEHGEPVGGVVEQTHGQATARAGAPRGRQRTA
jgi:tetratricopeptide (TPR) repeat protein